MLMNAFEKRALGFLVGQSIVEERVWIARVQLEEARDSQRVALAQNLHIENQEVLDELLYFGFGSDSVAALTLVPYLTLAWSDGRITNAEKVEILDEADLVGIESGSKAHSLLTTWFQNLPDYRLETTWGHFVTAYLKSLSKAVRSPFIEHFQRRMRKVAIASHPLWSPTLSQKERKTIERFSSWLLEAA